MNTFEQSTLKKFENILRQRNYSERTIQDRNIYPCKY